MHLDICMAATTKASKDKPFSPVRAIAGSPEEAAKISAEKKDKGAASASSPANINTSSNAFSHMMKRSAKVFSTNEGTKLAQRFHLNADGTLSLICYSTSPGLSQPDDIQWNTVVQLKVKTKAMHENTSDESVDSDNPAAIDLSLSSAIPSSPRQSRLVHRHSRLSIPVLKSILQKSIRRRKPLPAVRVAMELADKSLGDLLRRLPIIILEDSSLHPSFPLLIWLMVANSKNFAPNAFLMTKVFCCVYEMASCPWQDHLTGEEEDGQGETLDPSLESYHQPGLDKRLEDHEALIWSMLVRERYGGMGGDMQMLRAYANLWNERFRKDCDVPDTVRRRVEAFQSDGITTTTLRWSMIPTMIHQNAMRQSLGRVQPILEQGLASLTFMDITTEGVDFHCSSVLDGLVSDTEFIERCCTQLNDISASLDLRPVPFSITEKRIWLERVLKRCMWKYSAGVNRRLPMREIDTTSASALNKDDALQNFWLNFILPKTKSFAEKYVKERLG